MRTRVTAYDVAGALARRTSETAERFRREQTGQDVLEYSGLIVFIAIIIGLLFTIDVPHNVATAFTNAVNAVFQNNHTYTAPKALTVPNG